MFITQILRGSLSGGSTSYVTDLKRPAQLRVRPEAAGNWESSCETPSDSGQSGRLSWVGRHGKSPTALHGLTRLPALNSGVGSDNEAGKLTQLIIIVN